MNNIKIEKKKIRNINIDDIDKILFVKNSRLDRRTHHYGLNCYGTIISYNHSDNINNRTKVNFEDDYEYFWSPLVCYVMTAQ